MSSKMLLSIHKLLDVARRLKVAFYGKLFLYCICDTSCFGMQWGVGIGISKKSRLWNMAMCLYEICISFFYI